MSNEKKAIYQQWWFWLIIVLIIIGFIGFISERANTETATQPNNQLLGTLTATNEEIKENVEQPENKEDKEETQEPEEKPQQENNYVSKEYQNALIKAETYSDIMHMSKQAIYDQLVSEYGEQFPEDAAQYAVDNLKADYKKNALEKAKSYQDTMNMSKSAIYDQLTSEYGEQFTAEEAQYAIDNLD